MKKKIFIFPSNSIHIFISISYLCLLHIRSVRTAEDLLLQLCPDTGNYTFGSEFDINLTFLLSSVSNNASKTGYQSSSRGVSPDIVYALAQCRDDLSTLDCITCLNSASSNITGICPSGMEATVRFSDCLLRYSSSRFFSKTSNMMRSDYQTETIPSTYGPYFSQSLDVLMTSLSKTAASNETRFSYGDTEYDPSGTIYGMVQCIRDLSPGDCEKCLQDMISWFPNCCNGTTAATVFGPTCYLRYQTLPFIGESSQPPLHVPRFLPQTGRNESKGTGGGGKSNGGGKSSSTAIIIVTVVVSVVLLTVATVLFVNRKARKKPKAVAGPAAATATASESPSQSFLVDKSSRSDVSLPSEMSSPRFIHGTVYSLAEIETATNNFKVKLGSGGFGTVYKGTLPNHEEIAVKKLSKESRQGVEEFENEVNFLLKIQHGNIVKLLGYSADENEMLLVYEFLENKSLDKFIFDSTNKTLDWEKRHHIIKGIAQGLVFLHRDAKPKILHGDLKAGNILLDKKWDAKIADFGTAKVFNDQAQIKETRTISGTVGYWAPEYRSGGKVTVKCDVYAFGILVLEIISGLEVNKFKQIGDSIDLLSYARDLWEKETAMKLMDSNLTGAPAAKVERCIQIGLLCVRTNPGNRPDMQEVESMLRSDKYPLPAMKK